MGGIQSVISTATGVGVCLQNSIPSSLVALPTKLDYYLVDVTPYNLNIPVNPSAVTYPQTTAHVQAIVKCAAQYNYQVQAKSGGHSYGNFAYGGGDGNIIVVDLKNMKALSWDYSTWTAHVTGSWTLGDLTTAMIDAGNRMFAHGTCPQVGLGGHATIGGLGPPSRLYGTALDHIVAATIVTADGNAVNVSATENSDLFWSIKGAGASFGIITEMDVITHPAPSNITSYTYTFSSRPYAQHANRTKAWQTLVSDPALSRSFASQMIFTEIGMVIQGTFFGTQAEWDALNMTAVFPDSSSAEVVVLDDWAGALGQWAEDAALEIGGGLPNSFYAQSLAFTPETTMSDAAIDQFLAYLDSANPDTLLWFAIFDLAGGAVNDIAPTATSYAHRDALFYLQAYASNPLGKLSATSHNFIANMTQVLSQANPAVLANGEYPGYVDPSLVDPQEGYWRYNYPQLQQYKAKWDPNDMFHNPQSVRLP